MRKLIKATAAIMAAFFVSGSAEAAGLRTKFGEVVVRNIKVGQTYSLNSLINLPLKVLNTGDQTVDLLVDVIKPTAEQARSGYEIAPSTDWVRLDKTRFTVEPNHEAVTDVVVAIPNEPKLMGRKFEVDIWSRTQSKQGMFGVGMQSRLLLHISSEAPTEDELKKKFVDRKLANLDFTLLPTTGRADNVPVNEEVDLKKFSKATIKLINPNDDAINFRIRSVPNFEALLTVPAGYEEAYDPKWLRPAEEVVKVEGNSIKETNLLLNIADKAENYGKSFFFPVQVEVLEQEIGASVFYRLMVTTQSKKTDAKKSEEKK
jgi:hypothetical protein